MASFEIHGVDGNEAIIVEAMRAHGATVHKIGRPVDLLVAIHEQTALVEVKMPKKALRASQAKFLQTWPGVWAITRTVEDGIALVAALKTRARQQRKGQL